uniref:NADH dehydrogenase subunit 5 n=1 Tax=Trifida elongata TaxID=2929027 RepID=UPI002001296F|nr:NADH dehydrogenase subunit 5 [Trifida elongata]UNS15662.1 NADH dehydrogenase subunit 5 [Trifida elongata]
MIKFNFYLVWGFMILLCSLISFIFFLYFMFFDYSMMLEWVILSFNSYKIIYLMNFDWICFLFISVVLIISSMVILYSIDYMGTKSYSSNRFLFLILLFVLSMVLMIISPNLLSILLGWDGLGLVSYCLVIYYNSSKSYLAGMVTCLINRMGDIGLIMSIAWMTSYGSWHFMFYTGFFSSFMFYLVFISCFTKSAQIPFSIWLPAAMAAPTPVSSLVHSSTLVTAGVYLLIRFFYKFIYMNYFFILLSLLTMFMSSFCANYEFDLKKIIALSTLSQLGLMMSSLFLGLVNLTMFHLLTHAMFKSLLFLCAGIMIFYMNDNQDIRMMSSLSKNLPYTVASFNVANLALCGIPFLSGFYSKDMIVESSEVVPMNFFFFFFFFFCLGLTACYSIRLFYYSMIFDCKLNSCMIFYENFNLMKLSIVILTFFSVFFGCMIMWILLIDLTFIILPFVIKILTLLMVGLGFVLGSQIFEFKDYLLNSSNYLFFNMWFMFSYSYFVYLFFYKFSNSYKLNINWGEYYGASGISFYLNEFSVLIQLILDNNMKIMLVSFLIWMFILI